MPLRPVALSKRSYYDKKGLNTVPKQRRRTGMIFYDSKTKGIKKEFGKMEKLMKKLGFVRWSWDYERVTYDYKLSANGVNYYLRLSGDVVNDKRLEHPKALLELGTPVFSRHFFPHGLDDTAEVPEELKEKVQQLLNDLEKALLEEKK
jgi:hypothetical protein